MKEMMKKEELLYNYSVRIADNCLILSHRLSELCAKGPVLEEDIALTNISLDLLGQSSAFYKYSAELENKGRTEDDIAFHRSERHFYNFQLSEYPNIDFAYVIVRQFFSDVYHYYLFDFLSQSKDQKMAAISAKSLKEVTYHLRHSSHWLNILGNGSEESQLKIQKAVDSLWIYTGELFVPDDLDKKLLSMKIGVDLKELKTLWMNKINEVFQASKLSKPTSNYFMSGSKEGVHTECLGHILSDMQYLQRSYPGAEW
jgi:ring-1,2-phenylacetyl-CoA epoxidase subunit PaaC